MRVQFAPEEHFDWLLERIRYAPTLGFRALEAVDSSGRIGAMVGFDNWMPNSVQMHVAVDDPMCGRAILRPAFEAAFEKAGKGVVLGMVPGDRAKCVNLCRRLGFMEARIEDAWAKGVHLHVFEMRKEDCRWLRPAARKVA